MLKNLTPKGKQFEIMDLEMKGHNVVTGSAGAGKSVCALWRAKAIVNRLEEDVCILTYNNTLKNYLTNVIGDESGKIDITTFHKIATAYLREIGELGYNEVLDKGKPKLIKSAIEEVKKTYGYNSTLLRESFIEEEISWMQKVGCLTLDEYENVVRYGRGDARLDRSNRKHVFKVYEKYLKLRKDKGYRYDWDDIAYYANKFINEIRPSRTIKHVIIDEGQDFSPMMLKFMVNYVGDDGTFMYLGDSAQQIYGSNGTWKSSGLKIKKAYKLDQNYRNSKEIERFSNEIRKTITLDDQEVLKSENAIKSSEVPVVFNVAEEHKQIDILEKILDNTVKNNGIKGSIAILTVTNEDKKELAFNLDLAGIKYKTIDKQDNSFKGENGIYIGTYHAVKGLEFDGVVLYKCSDIDFNCQVLTDEDDKKEEIEKALKLLYVGATRAKKGLILIYSGELPVGFPKNRIMDDGKKLYDYRSV